MDERRAKRKARSSEDTGTLRAGKKNVDLPLAEVTEQAIHLLAREIGIVNTMRFLKQFGTGSGNYTAGRDTLFHDLSLDDVLSQVRGSAGESAVQEGR